MARLGLGGGCLDCWMSRNYVRVLLFLYMGLDFGSGGYRFESCRAHNDLHDSRQGV